MKHTRTLAKICSLIPFAIYGLFVFLFVWLAFTENAGVAFAVEFIFAFGWIPSLASAMAGVVFSLLSLKERYGKLFLVCSCVNVAIGVVWGLFALRMMLGSAWWQRL